MLHPLLERVLIASAGVLLYLGLEKTPIGTFIDKYAIWMVIASALLVMFSKQITEKTKIQSDVLIVLGTTTLFLSGKGYLIPYIIGNMAWVAIVVALAIITFKKKIAEMMLK